MKNGREKPEETVGRIVKKFGLTIGIAESCTGGLLCHRITSVPGSSDYFIGGVIAYNNDLKKHILNVPKEILQKFGAVSKETAKAMAWGAKKRLGSNIGIAITGIAGPAGRTKENNQRFLFKGTRQAIKLKASNKALNMLKEFLLKEYDGRR